MNTPDVTVLIPAYNSEAYVGEAVDSCLGQQWDFPYEILVVDDGSTDYTARVASSRGHPVRVIRLKANGGLARAPNQGLTHARGQIILRLDADDRMLPGRATKQCRYMKEHPEVTISFGRAVYSNAPEVDWYRQFGIPHTEIPPGDSFAIVERPLDWLLLYQCFIPHSTVAMRRDEVSNLGGYDGTNGMAEDYDLWLRAAASGATFAWTAQKLAWIRRQGHGNIMHSPKAYALLPHALSKALSDEKVLSGASERALANARRRMCTASNALLRYRWAYHGRSAVHEELDTLDNALPWCLRLKWQILSMLPPALGRWARSLKHSVLVKASE